MWCVIYGEGSKQKCKMPKLNIYSREHIASISPHPIHCLLPLLSFFGQRRLAGASSLLSPSAATRQLAHAAAAATAADAADAHLRISCYCCCHHQTLRLTRRLTSNKLGRVPFWLRWTNESKKSKAKYVNSGASEENDTIHTRI